MPPNPLLLNIGSRGPFICRSCLASIGKQKPNPRLLRGYSQSLLKKPQNANATDADGKRQAQLAELLGEGGPTVRYFEQEQGGKIRQMSGSEEFEEEQNTLDRDLERRLKELEEKLRDSAALKKALEKYGLKEKVDELERQYDEDVEGGAQDARWGLPKIERVGISSSAHRAIARLNTWLPKAFSRVQSDKLESKDIKNTWKYYSSLRRSLSANWKNVPQEVWQALWEVLSLSGDINPNRMFHVYTLAQDMVAAGISLGDEQELLAMEAMFIEGHQAKAVENWKRAVGTIGSKQGISKDYWELGVRMCSLHGDVDRAERAIAALIKFPDCDARALIHFIRTCAAREDTGEKAWTAYRQMRELLGRFMTIEDYDEVIACFLATGNAEYALHVFVDMMFSGAVELHGRHKLPSSVKNQFFFGKWLKRLIGAGDLEGAYRVLLLMQSHGVRAAAIQANGLIGAWLRADTAAGIQKAEELAWKMVESRLNFVRLRQREASVDWPVRFSESGYTPDASDLTFVPRATLETFSLMAENYRRRGLYRDLEKLWVAFKEAEIATDSFMMNQLLESHIAEGHGERARELYRMMVDHHTVPDGHTFMSLFRSLAVNSYFWPTLSEEQKEEDIALCRQIFRDMLESSWVFEAEGGLNEAQARLMLDSFRKSKDYVGYIVSLHALKEVFHFPISQIIVLQMVAEIGGVERVTSRNQAQLVKASRRIEHMVAEHRAAMMREASAELTPEEKVEELYAVLERYYRSKIPQLEDEFEEMYDTAAEEMGAYDDLVRKRSRGRR
ncbi:Pentatricopeptide repeat domain-containing protein [Pleurostoma richardsiae]|uniref:Pentatricopeptide repeat domain-containing protein n=1 Tax=Pleurostoma richardsiae TaxID=41990 RepID=A0AA38VR07_9PEZI|nr:Pentatricopeptide repeat domain-containing protein [Pleurostoma richardsiae]